MLRALLIGALVFGVATASASAEGALASAKCGQIVFEPQTDNGAANIRASGTSCRRARRIVRAVYNGNRQPFGYRCRSRAHDEGGLFFRHWVCTKNQARVTWDKY
jgi:hypothetical protein